MTEKIEPRVRSTELALQREGEHTVSGRAFVSPALDLPDGELQSWFDRAFIDDDDIERLPLLREALSAGPVVVDTYPDCDSRGELHAYVLAPAVTEAPLFACVLATTEAVKMLLREPPHAILETATFQVVGDRFTTDSVPAALQNWASRVFGLDGVEFTLHPWTEHADAGLPDVSEKQMPSSGTVCVAEWRQSTAAGQFGWYRTNLGYELHEYRHDDTTGSTSSRVLTVVYKHGNCFVGPCQRCGSEHTSPVSPVGPWCCAHCGEGVEEPNV